MHVAPQRPTGAGRAVMAVVRLWQPHARQWGAVAGLRLWPPNGSLSPAFQRGGGAGLRDFGVFQFLKNGVGFGFQSAQPLSTEGLLFK